ncbi:MAG TPA: carboxypeptidase regulatory-like domain-containing protein, partial [Bacteroidota bacterium]
QCCGVPGFSLILKKMTIIMTLSPIVGIFFLIHTLTPSLPDPSEMTALPPVQEPTGVIEGTVTIPTLPPSRSPRSSRYRRGAQTPEVLSADDSEMGNVVIYLEGKGWEAVRRSSGSEKPVLDQRNAEFIPHVLPIVKGTSVRIVNRDRTYHNVFSLSSVKKFNIGRRPTGEEVPVSFEKSGVIQVFCDIHSNMSAFIVVLENPAFTQPSESGEFRLAGIPAGTFTVNAWHERLAAPSQQITVRAGETTKVSFTLQ